MIREKPRNFSSGLCFEEHSHFLLLQKRMSRSSSLNDSFLIIHPEHIIEVVALQKQHALFSNFPPVPVPSSRCSQRFARLPSQNRLTALQFPGRGIQVNYAQVDSQ